jgi:hypothetical protein
VKSSGQPVTDCHTNPGIRVLRRGGMIAMGTQLRASPLQLSRRAMRTASVDLIFRHDQRHKAEHAGAGRVNDDADTVVLAFAE